jgi:hypothetical protein
MTDAPGLVVADRILAMEAVLKAEGKPWAQVIRRAGAGASTWLRWRRGEPATEAAWKKVEAAFAEVCPFYTMPWQASEPPLLQFPPHILEAVEKLFRVRFHALVACRAGEGVVFLEPSEEFNRLVAAIGAGDIDFLIVEIDRHLGTPVVGLATTTVAEPGAAVRAVPGEGGQ